MYNDFPEWRLRLATNFTRTFLAAYAYIQSKKVRALLFELLELLHDSILFFN